MSDENRVAAVEKTLGEAGQQVQAPVRLSYQEPAAVAGHRPAVESGADPARKMPFKFEFGLATLCHSKGRLFFGVNCCVETQLCHERRLFARPPVRKGGYASDSVPNFYQPLIIGPNQVGVSRMLFSSGTPGTRPEITTSPS